MRDVHAMAPEGPQLDLQHVGIDGIRKPLHVERAGRSVALTASFAVTVDLPAGRKGSDLSRNAEVLAEVVDRTATHPVPSLESACLEIARELLVRHAYARRSTVRARAAYFLERGLSTDRTSLEDFELFAEAEASRGADGAVAVARRIGAEAVGMTACPCAMETVREELLREYPALGDPSLRTLPIITHNQRNRTRLTFELPPGADVEADAMIAAIEAAQSVPTYAILKRGDEARAVLLAHRAPKFVEDVLRDLLASVPLRFAHLPDATGVRAETRSEESIHKYDVVAEHTTTLGALRASTA